MTGGSPHATARSVWIVRGGSGPSCSGSPDTTWAHVASTVAFADGGAGAVVIGARAAAPPLGAAELAGAEAGLPPSAKAITMTTGTATAVAMRALRRVRASMAYRYK
jgi:hypothetical protein